MHAGERHRQAACAVSGTFFEGYLKQLTAAHQVRYWIVLIYLKYSTIPIV